MGTKIDFFNRRRQQDAKLELGGRTCTSESQSFFGSLRLLARPALALQKFSSWSRSNTPYLAVDWPAYGDHLVSGPRLGNLGPLITC